ncbi:LysR family transcriptional regulator [Reinekea sp.]|uniref:LysR family transcriptional regulator n=1 Tax=Reinekea sp. TaxID=1970455 RepID=UPI003989A036
MDIESICWFVEVVYAGSFTGAAKRLRQPSSNISRRIAKLEESLGYKLLLRTTRSLSLTQEGESLLPLAKQLSEAQAKIVDWNDSMQAEATGALRITAPSSFARGPLTEWIIRYRQMHPKVDIELIHSNDYLDFQEHRLNIAFRQGPLPDSGLISKRLFSIHYGVFVSPDVLVDDLPLVEPPELLSRALIATGAQGRSLPWRFQEHTLQPKTTGLIFEDATQCLLAAKAGQGYTYASRYEAMPFLDSGELVEVLSHSRADPFGFYVVYPNRDHLSKKNETFLTHILLEIEAFGRPDGLSP